MNSKIHCGINPPKSGKRRGTVKECIAKKQVYYYGYRPIIKPPEDHKDYLAKKDVEVYFDPDGTQEEEEKLIKKEKRQSEKTKDILGTHKLKKKLTPGKEKALKDKATKKLADHTIQDKILEERDYLYNLIFRRKKNLKICQIYGDELHDLSNLLLDLKNSIPGFRWIIRDNDKIQSKQKIQKAKKDLAKATTTYNEKLEEQKKIRNKYRKATKLEDEFEEKIAKSKDKINKLAQELSKEEVDELTEEINRQANLKKKKPAKRALKTPSTKKPPSSKKPVAKKTTSKKKKSEEQIKKDLDEKLPQLIEDKKDEIDNFRRRISKIKRDLKYIIGELEIDPDHSEHRFTAEQKIKEVEELTKGLNKAKTALEKLLTYQKNK
jgi:hypothetical protein